MTGLSGTGAQSVGTTSTKFLDNLKARRPEAWHRLVRLYGPLIYHWCRRLGAAAEDAGDLVQEVFGSVAVGLADYRHDRPDDSFRGWLRTVTRNKVRNFFRDRGAEARAQGGTDAQQRLLQISDPLPDDSEPGRQAAEESGVAHRALEAIRADFEDRTWRAFYATTVDGRPARDVAADLGMSVQAVYKAKSRVLQRLREELVE